MQPMTQAIRLEPFKVACSSCIRARALPARGHVHRAGTGSTPGGHAPLAFRRGDTLYARGDAFASLYAVRTGFFKTCVSSEDGRDQVTGFQMGGELLGLDGIGTDRHTCDAVALEDANVCVIPYHQLEDLSRELTDLQRQFHRIMSREIVRDHGVMLLLGSMRAEERLAAFLLNLTQRLHARGFSGSSLVLRMTREEIGSYLGLQARDGEPDLLAFQDDGLLEVRQRQIGIVDAPALQALVNGSSC